ncbi:hypothetical protein NQ176_g5697 [Zarea fungicola]|uniref:Uncharacterized protein n=1 Tax=Zarea fungicola TaxID=93591 RepID=A0ACC1N8B3_9HYPO|nr:hypothetical protein NQ176_g5697 [Lecanicillium fungicola]
MPHNLPADMDSTEGNARDSTIVTSDEMPACQSCRKKKLKCSREQPSCSQCTRLSCECVYSLGRQRPGLRTGAVDNLNRRIVHAEALENLLAEKESQSQPRHSSLSDSHNSHSKLNSDGSANAQGCLYHAALLIANQYLANDACSSQIGPSSDYPRPQYGHANYQQNSDQRHGHVHAPNPHYSRKRKYHDLPTPTPQPSTWDHLDNHASFLPATEIMTDILHAYFSTVHHWIPFIHQKRLLRRLQDPTEATKLSVLLHAITVTAIRQVKLVDFPMDHAAIEQQIRVSRNIVMLNAFNGLCVENLQALALVAFDHMGSANFPRAWAIVASLVKSLEYLQLTVEPDQLPRRSFMRPLSLLPKSQSAGETEERRRVFWNIFLLDRFLAVTSGWNPSLNAQEVSRRLPSNGRLWNSNESGMTPFFGILDRSAPKIGNIMSYVGPRSAAAGEPPDQNQHPEELKEGELFNVGALAFRIEATESLSQVTSLFLQQEVDFRNREDVSKWLTRFKELDLRLVHWKFFFPQRWGDSSVSKEEKSIEMDPNLTAAHLIHNASMILLHQHIAYPVPELIKNVKLPSSCSADTCVLAAVEISSIIGKFLSNISYLAPAQIAFCAFIAARILLVHSRFYDTPLSPEFSNLTRYLRDMSRRWDGPMNSPPEQNVYSIDVNVAGRYAYELQRFHDRYLEDPGFCTQILIYPFTVADPDADPLAIRHPDTGLFIGRDIDHHSVVSPDQASPSMSIRPGNQASKPAAQTGASPVAFRRQSTTADVQNGQFGTSSHAQQPMMVEQGQPSLENDPWGDELAAMSQALLDQQFADMDRVFTLSGTDFTFDISGWDAMTDNPGST